MDLSQQLHYLRKDLTTHYKEAQWTELSRALETLAQLSQHEGQRELCLRAQSLREIMGHKAGGCTRVGTRVDELFHDLIMQVSHLQWRKTQNSFG